MTSSSTPWNLLPSSKLSQLPLPSQYYAYAIAYLDSAIRLCTVLARSRRKATYERGAVILYLTQHALELFYKGAILKKAPTERFSHGLPQLQGRYNSLYPARAFRVRELFKVSYENLSKEQIAQVQGLEPPADQLYRYPENKNGKPWSGLHAFEAASFLKELQALNEEIRLAWVRVEQPER